MRNFVRSKKLIIFFIVISIFSISLTSCDLETHNGLTGDWAIDWFSSSSTYLAGDLVFGEAKSLALTDALTGANQNLRYAVIGPGKMKLTIDEVPIVADFTIEENVLSIQFDDGTNRYQRVEVEPADDDLTVFSEQEDDLLEETATQPNMNLIFPPTSTSIPLVSSTPSPADTSIPVVVQQPSPTRTPNNTPTPQIYSPLSRCAASRLHVGDSAYVNYETGRIGMRSEPVATIGDKLVRKLEEGEILHIIDGPKCDLGWVFWKVRTVYSETGWIPEGDGIEFWVVPITTYDVCSGAKPTRLRVGDRAFVEPEPEDFNRIYPEPAIDSTKLLYRMEPGSYMEVLEGPSCGSGKTGVWWYVRSEDSDIEGWTRESDYSKSYYFIAPVIPRP